MEHLPDVVNDTVLQADLENQCGIAVHTNVPRQQIINSPCPICGDKITGYHYGIFSCESCKGFFKRSVQNRKNYTCLRSGTCSVNISTRKKCAACRYNKCLQHGMRIEAIREDRTRGGRSTYPCAFPSPAAAAVHSSISNVGKRPVKTVQIGDSSRIRSVPSASALSSNPQVSTSSDDSSGAEDGVPKLIQEIMAVEPLWHQSEGDDSQELMLSEQTAGGDGLPDHRLYRIVKWCKSLPLFKNIQIDDQICLLLNSWCELLLLSCCYRSIPANNELRLSGTKTLNLDQGRNLGLGVIIERMLNLTDHLRRMKLDEHEYVCLKVVILLNSDVPGISEPGQVRSSQEKVIQALQAYTLSHYPSHPSKFGELLLRIPELQRTCQIGKESLVMKQRDGEVPGFNLLLELLQADQSEQVDEIVTK